MSKLVEYKEGNILQDTKINTRMTKKELLS